LCFEAGSTRTGPATNGRKPHRRPPTVAQVRTTMGNRYFKKIVVDRLDGDVIEDKEY
jgi:hypothetical protein